jgi:LEA14-like dessication related protein
MRVGLIAFLLFAVAGCATAPRPDVFVIGIEPLPGGTLEQRVRVELRVQNPSTQRISATGMSMRLLVNGQPLARGVSAEAFSVPPLGEATTSVVASTTLFDLMRQVYGAQASTGIEYRLEGKLYLDDPLRGSLSFEREGTLAPQAGTASPPRR